MLRAATSGAATGARIRAAPMGSSENSTSVVEGVGRRHAHPVVDPGDFGRVTMAKIEIVVGQDRLAEVLDAVVRGAHTGRHGDGKVFVSRVEQVLRLRTGETDLSALE